MHIALYTLGCKVNQYDTQMMSELLENNGHQIIGFQNAADCYIINTCTVTNMSDKKSRQIISRCKKLNPNAIIVVCGCYAQISPTEAAAIDGVDIVIGTANRKNIATYIEEFRKTKQQIVTVDDLLKHKKLCGESISKFDEKTRAILKIEDGCRNFCSYCAIPFARGLIRSKSKEDIIAELRALQVNQYQEVVLTGIHLASYGKDLKDIDLADAILLADTFDFPRIRLGSLEPNIITRDFLDKIKNAKSLMPSFHLSLQSGSDSVLKRMNRKYSTKDFENAVNLLRLYYPNCAITTDIIVGFPGETETEFSETLYFAQKISFAKIHIFPFSPRKGTKAAEMKDQISSHIKGARCKLLETIEQKSRESFMKLQVGKTLPVLFEQNKDGCWEGYTENYLPVILKSEENLGGKLITTEIVDTDGYRLISK